MAQTECVESAKRNIVDMIYSSARIEGIGLNFQETRQIFDGIKVESDVLTRDDFTKIINLKKCWSFVLDSIEYPLDYLYIRQLSKLVNEGGMSDAGYLRNYVVVLGGTFWKPDIPNKDEVEKKINELTEIPCVTQRARRIMLYLMRGQLF